MSTFRTATHRKQLQAVGATDDNTVIERFHGKIPEREEYQRLKNHWLKPGDTLVIYDLEALGGKRSARQELQYYREHDIHVKIVNIPTTTIDHLDNPEISNMILDTVISTLDYVISHEIERTKKHQTQGVDRIRDKPAWNNYGRPQIQLPANYDEVMQRWTRGDITAAAAMGLTGLSRTTFYRLAHQYKNGGIGV
ncbi:recombinase family protein [Blautia obeum]|uniref:recombinase family protein n=1 Tax=Blautia obeum TaxID=40520 RepID=UPI002432ED6A|nr:recombinase family protein [Blautia obeum]